MSGDGITMSIEDLVWAVGELAETSTQDFEVDDLLRQLCQVASTSLPVDGVGVMKTDRHAATRFLHASDPPLTGLEELQEALQEGPCRDAIDTGQMVSAGSIAQMRWPAFKQAAAAIGMHAVLAVPLISRDRTWGTLDLYWRTDHEPTKQDRSSAQLLANVAVSYLSMAQDRAAARQAHDLLAHQVLHDQLTGLPNRQLMEELIDHALAAAGRRGALVAVAFIDLDHFKAINDTHGHRAGDEVLTVVARRLQAAVRAGDTAGRISGDEFLVVCEDIPDQPQALEALTRLGHRIRAAIAEPIRLTNTATTVTVTASIGIGMAVATDNPTAAALIHTADAAMYQAKTATGIITTRWPEP